jgi:N utilization substance protein A
MAKKAENRNIDFTNSSVRNMREGDVASEETLDRLEQITGGSEQPKVYRGNMARETAKLNASTEEEVDALRVNLTQDSQSMNNTRYGTGVIADDVAREQIAGVTEVGPELDDKGVNSVVPGRENTSARLRRHHPDTALARSENVVEGNLDEPRDELRTDRKVDEGTAA